MTGKSNRLLSLVLAVFACISLVQPLHAKSHFAEATADPAQDNLKAGLALIRKGNYEAAIDSFQQAIYFSRNQYNPDAYKYLGLCYKATRQYPKAITALSKHLEQTTEEAPDAHIDLAETYIDVGEFEKGRHEIEEAFRQSAGKGFWRQRYAMGELNEKMADHGSRQGDYGMALQFYEQAIQDKKNYTEAWMGKARMNVRLKRPIEALKDYRQILEAGPLMHPDYEELYYNMGQCLLMRGDHQGALDHWRMALEHNPDSYNCHLALANLLDSEKHYSSAAKEYELALRVLPQESPDRLAIMRKLQWIEQQTQPKEVVVPMRPSPSMRQQYDEANQPQKVQDPLNNAPVSKESGF